MLDNEEDLRVRKTRKAIRSAFMRLLSEKDLDKIRVVELCRAAEISKGTFYLHYEDIYSLYREVLRKYLEEKAADHRQFGQLLKNPEAFVRDFFSDRDLPEDEGRYLLKVNNVQYCQNLLHILISTAVNGILATGILPESEENRTKLHFLIGGMYALAISLNAEGRKSVSEAEVEYLARQIHHSFRL